MADPIEQALASLREKASVLAAESQRVAAAIAALERLVPSAPAKPARQPSSYHPDRPSVRTMVVALLDEADRDWSAGEIITEYHERGNPIHGKDPSNALRAALSDAKKRGMIVATNVGRYRSAKWATAPARQNGLVTAPPEPPEPSDLPPGEHRHGHHVDGDRFEAYQVEMKEAMS